MGRSKQGASRREQKTPKPDPLRVDTAHTTGGSASEAGMVGAVDDGCGYQRARDVRDALDDDVSRASAWSRVSARDFATTLDSGRALVVDVRPAHAFAAARLPDSVSAPIDRLDERAWRDIDARSRERGDADDIVHFICAGGVNSQRAAEWFSTLPDVVRRGRRARDVRGGFASWRRDVDPTFPKLD